MSDDEKTSSATKQVWKGGSQAAYKREQAYKHLGVSPKDVDSVPRITPELNRIPRVIRSVNRNHPSSPLPTRPLDYLYSSNDEVPDFVGNRGTAAITPALPTPVHSESLSVPGNDRFRFDDEERRPPFIPQT